VRSNCLVWALRHWRYRRGDYLLIRKSRWGWWPHFLLSRTAPDDCISFVPKAKHRRRRLPPLLFHGRIKRGDARDER